MARKCKSERTARSHRQTLGMPHIPNSHPSKRLRLETFEIESDDIDDVEPAIKLESGGDMAPEPDVKLEPAIKLESSLENAMENNVESEPTIKWEPGLEIEIENDFVPEPTVKLEQSIGMEAEASVKVEPNVLDPPIGPRSTHGSRRHLIAIEERLLLLRPLDPTARRGKWKLASTLPIDVLPTGARIERNAANLPLPLVELLTELWSGAYKSCLRKVFEPKTAKKSSFFYISVQNDGLGELHITAARQARERMKHRREWRGKIEKGLEAAKTDLILRAALP